MSLALQSWRSSVGARLEDTLEHAHRELAADDRSHAQAALGRVGQLVDARQKEAVQTCPGSRWPVIVSLAIQRSPRRTIAPRPMSMRMTSSTKKGLPSERVRIRLANRFGQRLDLEQVGDELAAVAFAEWLEADFGDARRRVTSAAGKRGASPELSVSARPTKRISTLSGVMQRQRARASRRLRPGRPSECPRTPERPAGFSAIWTNDARYRGDVAMLQHLRIDLDEVRPRRWTAACASRCAK